MSLAKLQVFAFHPVFALTQSNIQSLSVSCALNVTQRKLLELSNNNMTPHIRKRQWRTLFTVSAADLETSVGPQR